MDSIKIYKLDSKGRGIGRYNDKPIFIFNALVDEEVLVNNINERSKYVTANVEKLVVASRDRIEPICPYFGKCGGCDLMHMPYEKQLRFKYDKVNNTISSLVDKNIVVNDIKYSDDFNYRNKAIFKVDKSIGFYGKNSHDVVSLDKCYLVNDKINQILEFLKTKNLNNVESVLVRATSYGSMVVLSASTFTDFDFLDELKEIVDTCVLDINGDETILFGEGYIIEKLENFSYKISPKSFFQVNSNVAFKLYSEVKDNINSNDKVLDLYCGTGSIGIFLSDKASYVKGVEINESAIKDANYNKDLNSLRSVEFKCLDTSNFNEDLSSYDVVVVDPPRSGLNLKTINYLINENVPKIIYVSCDLMTLTRDLNILKDKYVIKSVTPFDMFPNTYHVENVCVLERK